MSNQNQANEVHTPKRRGRGCLVWLAALVVGLSVFALAGSIYESFAENADVRDYPPPGQLVDVGGHRLHLYCAGKGSPTVVIDAGLGDWSISWRFVQMEVAKTTQVCTYDRAGMGWSEAGPLPRNAAQFVQELHTLLQQANIPAPYVMVGHSLGGFPVRIFTQEYPSEVAGVVLVDSMSPGQFSPTMTDRGTRPTSQSPLFSILPGLARIGVGRIIVGVLGMVGYAAPEEKAYYAYLIRPQSIQAFVDESQGMPESGEQAKAVKSFGDLPLIVLSRGLDQRPEWMAMQAELLQLSSNSEQLIADQSGHGIASDQPEAAIGAILTMVDQVR